MAAGFFVITVLRPEAKNALDTRILLWLLEKIKRLRDHIHTSRADRGMSQRVNHYHAISWTRPKECRMVKLINQAINRLTLIELSPGSTVYKHFFAESPVFKPSKSRRERRKRRDGATNVITQLKAIFWYADVGSNFVAKPVKDVCGRTTYERKTIKDLNVLAYGGPIKNKVSVKRTERATRDLTAMGYLRTAQWRTFSKTDGYKSAPGLKWITDKLWRALGLMKSVMDERGQRKAAKEHEKATRLREALTQADSFAMRRGCPPNGDTAAPAEVLATSPAPAPDTPPKRSALGDAEIAAMWALLHN